MRVSISKITKELDIKPFQLHKWEERGWLGNDPILRNPDENGQRIYNEQQVERIEFIDETIKRQREQKIHRTDPKEMDKLLLEKFGGEVTRMESEELVVFPKTIESFQGLLVQQSQEMNAMRETIEQLAKGQVELRDYIEKSLPNRVQLEEHDRELLLSLKETLEAKDQLAITTSEKKKWWKFW